jgi:integrase
MATIETRQTPDGKTSYRVKIRIRGFPSQSATFERKTDAKNWASQTETAMREGRHFKTTQAKKYTVADLIKRYLDYQKTRNSKRAAAVEMYLNWWKSELGAYALADVSKTLILEKRDRLIATGKNVERRSPATANRYMTALSHAFSVAVNEWEWLQEHPMGKIAKLPESRGRVRFLSDDERTRLLAACTEINSEFIYPLVVLALSTGARHGELINLQWKDVDFRRKAIVLQDTKNGERRVLPLAHHALELMQAQYEGRDKVSSLVFPSPREPSRPWESRAAWLAALEKAKIDDFRFHDLRHTAASYLAMNGASTNEIAEVLGHKTLAMVKRYSHLSEVHTAGVVEKMNKKIFEGA